MDSVYIWTGLGGIALGYDDDLALTEEATCNSQIGVESYGRDLACRYNDDTTFGCHVGVEYGD